MAKRQSISDTVLHFIKTTEHDCIIAAFSGGADSSVLLHSLQMAAVRLRRRGIKSPDIVAAHCNFHLRGDESERDMVFARRICEKMGVELLTIEFDTETYCRERKLSIEMGARQLRHQWFSDLCHERNGVLATGHNADDNAETLMLNLLRGSGVRGLKGMLPRQGHIIRPLLSFNRSEILEYTREHGLDYVTDSTNLDSDYRRNYLRNEVFPMLESRWPGLRRAMATTLRCLADDNAIIEQVLSEQLPQPGQPLLWSVLRDFAAPRLLLLRHFEPYGITPDIADEISTHISSPRPGAEWHLTAGRNQHAIIKAAADGLHIISDINNDPVYADRYRWVKVKLNDDNRSEQMDYVRSLSLTECALPGGEEQYIWVHPEAGMRMRPLGMHGTRLVSDIIRDARLSPEDKSRIQILCRRRDREPIWIPGVKRAAADTIDNNCDSFHHLFRDPT